MTKFLFLIILMISNSVFANESADAFIVTLSDEKIKVVSPKKKQKVIGVIVKNETFDNSRPGSKMQ